MAAVTGGSVSVSTSGRPGKESRVDPGNMLGGSAESRMSLADTVSGGQLVSE